MNEEKKGRGKRQNTRQIARRMEMCNQGSIGNLASFLFCRDTKKAPVEPIGRFLAEIINGIILEITQWTEGFRIPDREMAGDETPVSNAKKVQSPSDPRP
jgi:hypothetical protein